MCTVVVHLGSCSASARGDELELCACAAHVVRKVGGPG